MRESESEGGGIVHTSYRYTPTSTPHLGLQDLVDHALRNRHVLHKRAHAVLYLTPALQLAAHCGGLDLKQRRGVGKEGRAALDLAEARARHSLLAEVKNEARWGGCSCAIRVGWAEEVGRVG